MDQHLCRRLMPRPKFSRSRPTTAAAAPATFRLVHLQVVRREHMAVAADTGYGHGLEDTFQGKAHHISFGCFKARPRYHLQRIAPSCNGLPRRAPPLRSRAAMVAGAHGKVSYCTSSPPKPYLNDRPRLVIHI